MNIFAIEGHRVKCRTLDAGYESDREKARKYLEVGKQYIIRYTIVHSSSTDVYLMEFPNIMFNSVLFDDVVPQSDEDNQLHQDYIRWRR